jgi:hypothetical protein
MRTSTWGGTDDRAVSLYDGSVNRSINVKSIARWMRRSR